MVNFEEVMINEHLSRIFGLGDACMYLIKGNKRGILVDTAYGAGDLKGYIDSIFDKPYDVVITHGHADHANGIAQFDKVYMNHRDMEIYYTKVDINLRRQMLKRTVADIAKYPDDVFQPKFNGEFIDLQDGQIFDLGDVHVKAIWAPGHTQGMMTLLIEEDRIMIFGDACGVCTFLFKPESSTVLEYKNTLLKLKGYEDDYDIILRQHGTCESPKSILDENLEVANLILDNKDDHIPFEYLGEHVWMACEVDENHNRKDGKNGNIVYATDKIR